ncbi:MAG: G-D-S-L family lipolytic protein, partial [Cyclobacteriaceae bacterium]|nr:G-D-S-L family lipolytic protein [Cyclobacteriaceae bacterium HetDA_MAG_MS6]
SFCYMMDICAQDPVRFEDQILEIQSRTSSKQVKDPIIFAGSSSIRMWEDINTYFPGLPILNHGFGGSQMSDLIYYVDELILDHQPSKVFLYEGDNDLAEGKTVEEVMEDTKKILKLIRQALDDIPVYLISVKPSIARWSLKYEYIALNNQLASMAEKLDNTIFIDVWNPMLENGELQTDIFIEDGLHMNRKGYDIWGETISPHLK